MTPSRRVARWPIEVKPRGRAPFADAGVGVIEVPPPFEP